MSWLPVLVADLGHEDEAATAYVAVHEDTGEFRIFESEAELLEFLDSVRAN